MNRTSYFAQSALAAVLVLLAGRSLALDLLGSYEQARKFDPSIRAADEAAVAGREKAVQGRSLLLPQVSLSASMTHVDDKSNANLPPPFSDLVRSESSGNMNEVALKAKQPLYNAEDAANKLQLQQQTELSDINYRNAQQDLMQRTSEAYFGVLLAQEALRVAQAEKAAVQSQRDRAQARFDVGRGKITDLHEAQARYDSVVAREVSAQSTLALRQAQYQELTGAAADGLAELRPGFVPISPQPDNLQQWQLRALDHSARVLSKHSEVAIATAEIDKYKLSGRPTLDLVASYTRKGQTGGVSTISPDSNRGAAIGVQLTVPLFAGGAIVSKLRESSAKKRQAEEELAAAQRDARLQVQDAFLSVKTGVARLGALDQSVLSAQTALEATTLGRDVGTRTELDVLDAQQRLFSAQLDLAQARNDYLLGRIRLASAAGELREDDLRELNAYLAR